MEFVAGFIIGLVAGIVLGRHIYRKKTIYEKIKGIIGQSGGKIEPYIPRVADQIGSPEALKAVSKAMVFMPLSEHDLARERVLERNKALGVDTNIEDLT